jgi:hypothetical protein
LGSVIEETYSNSSHYCLDFVFNYDGATVDVGLPLELIELASSSPSSALLSGLSKTEDRDDYSATIFMTSAAGVKS